MLGFTLIARIFSFNLFLIVSCSHFLLALHPVETVDKYGRVRPRNAVDLKKFYSVKDKKEEEEVEDEESENEGDFHDYARGMAAMSSSSEEDNDQEDDDEEHQSNQDPYSDFDDDEVAVGAKDEIIRVGSSAIQAKNEVEPETVLQTKDVPEGEPTKRFAVVNMDWDNLSAMSLLQLFDAFKPKNGFIKNVKIYPSEFGKVRLEQEEREGPPKEIFKSARKDSELAKGGLIQNQDDEDDFDPKQLRKYQLERLRYSHFNPLIFLLVIMKTVHSPFSFYYCCLSFVYLFDQ